ncbi:MAG: Ldh family oxidoreductase [Gammaproteobacteria bacterium]|nr:Ldh family oxidoreductase [Gammaproteobacteria bacterium]
MRIEAAKDLAMRVLEKHGVGEDVAEHVADVLVDADARGVVTHGLTRLPAYVARIRAGLLDPGARPVVVADNGALLLLDAGNGFGAVAGCDAADLAADRAARHGCAWVTVRNGNHLSMLGYYARRLAGRGFAALAMTNAGPSMAAWGGTRPVVGTNPLAMAVPGEGPPVVLDMAATMVARGKIRRAQAEGKAIPEGWAFDARGNPTTDADEAMSGTLAPVGGHKGYALSVMIDLMTGVLGAGSFASQVRTATDRSGPSGVCFTLIAADIGKLPDAGDYLDRLKAFRTDVEASGDGTEAIHLPGDIENARANAAERDGIELPEDVLKALEALLEQ